MVFQVTSGVSCLVARILRGNWTDMRDRYGRVTDDNRELIGFDEASAWKRLE